MRNACRNGFTLLEMSMVLLIIALIMGGILIGRDLIRAGEVRATLSQMDKYSAAAMAFRMKYNCLPGDCAGAVSFGLGTAWTGPGDNGDGDRHVYSFPWVLGAGQQTTQKEFLNFWYHLQKAGLIEGTFNGYIAGQGCITTGAGNCPAAKMGHGTYICAFTLTQIPGGGFAQNNMVTGNVFFLSSLGSDGGGCVLTSASVPTDEAFAIDSKIDDGNPNAGIVHAAPIYSGPATPDVALFWNGPGYCTKAAAPTQYDPAGSGCALAIGGGKF
jgi:prepilin-type N-terminal cleavage/methylation domain-containing protein